MQCAYDGSPIHLQLDSQV